MISRVVATAIYSLLGPVRVLHPERSAMPGPCVLASNHISHFDPPLISVAARRRIDWMAMKDLFKHPFAAFYFYSIDTFPVDREHLDRASVKTALKRLKKGRIVGMFPEGGIRAGSVSVLEGAPLHPGAAVLAQMAGVPLLPCVVLGTDRLYNKKNWRLFGSVPVLGRLRRTDPASRGDGQGGSAGLFGARTGRRLQKSTCGDAQSLPAFRRRHPENTAGAEGGGMRNFSNAGSIRRATL